MSESSIKLQLDGIEQQLKILKSRILKQSRRKKLSTLYGIYEGKLDMPLEEIQKHKYPSYEKV